MTQRPVCENMMSATKLEVHNLSQWGGPSHDESRYTNWSLNDVLPPADCIVDVLYNLGLKQNLGLKYMPGWGEVSDAIVLRGIYLGLIVSWLQRLDWYNFICQILMYFFFSGVP